MGRVTCQTSTHIVIGLDLSCSLLQGPIYSNSSLFSLKNLRRLNLAGNFFYFSPIPHEFFWAFPSMTHLNLSNSGFSGIVPVSMISQYLSGLISLDLGTEDYEGLTIEDNVGLGGLISNLTQLAELVLDLVNMSAISAVSLTNMSSNLKTLSLFRCELQGTFPNNIFHLPNLRTIYLSYNPNLKGNLPQTNWTCPLVSLDVSRTNFSGSIPQSLGNLTSMKYLDLFGANFSGPIPRTLQKLTSLTYLDLTKNQFSGTLNFEIFAPLKALEFLRLGQENNKLIMLLQSDGNCSFPRLKELHLTGNLHSTGLPYFLNYSTELERLNLNGNNIGGPIPEWVWRNKLTDLSLEDNNFVGEISSSICKLSSLKSLDLSDNSLTGTIPTCMGNLSSLYELNLGQNRLRGPMPRALANCTNLVYLYLQSNKFHGIVEDIPFSSLMYFNLSNNYFVGGLPIPPPTLAYYVVGNNKFEGGIPHQICDAFQLQIIDISNNSLTGSIPRCFKNLTASLEVLDLSANSFVGRLPEIFSRPSTVIVIHLSKNQIQGRLPRSLSNCERLEILDVGENALNGSFPNWLETLPYLQVLVLRSNNFHSTVVSANKTDHPFNKLRILDISDNKFFGLLPTKYIASLVAMKSEERGDSRYMAGKGEGYYSVTVTIKGTKLELIKILEMFTAIDFSRNLFEGEIPKAVGELRALKGLNLSQNNLSGTIPASIGGLINLEWLDLSSNRLSGEIPMELGDLTFLGTLNLSVNQLIGPIPGGTQMDTFRSDSFEGNVGLCGRPLPKVCEKESQKSPTRTAYDVEKVDESKNWIEWSAVWMGLGCGVVLGISIFYMVEETRKPWLLAKLIERQLDRRTKKHMGQGCY